MQGRGRLTVAQAYSIIISHLRHIVAIARDRTSTMLGGATRESYGTRLPDPCVAAESGGDSSRRLIRMGTWNPMNLAALFRVEEVSRAFKTLNILGLIGTARREWTTVGHSRTSTPDHTVISFGYNTGKLTNRSAGCALLLGAPCNERHIH